MLRGNAVNTEPNTYGDEPGDEHRANATDY